MSETILTSDPFAFLPSKMAAAAPMRSVHWKETPLGDPAFWPAGLKYALTNLIHNRAPAFLCWGSSRLLFWNEAFGELFPVLKEQAPGVPVDAVFGSAPWTSSLIDALQGTGCEVRCYAENRHAELSILLMPQAELDGTIAGVAGICRELPNIPRQGNGYLRHVVENVPVGICVLSFHPLHILHVNDDFCRALGLDSPAEAQVLRSIKERMGDIEEPVLLEMPRSLRELSTVLPDGRIFYTDFLLAPVPGPGGRITGMTIIGIDVTERVLAQASIHAVNEELAAANEELAASNEALQIMNDDLALAQRNLHQSLEQVIEREQQIREMVASAPFPIAMYTGREMRITEVNESIIQVWGKGGDVVGKTYREVLPELEEQMIYPQLEQVFDTGIPFHARNQRIDLDIAGKPTTFYFNYSFTPLHDTHGRIYGIMNTAADVTDLVLAKQAVERSEQNFRSMILQAPVAMCLLEGAEYKVTLANDAMLEIWGRDYAQVAGLPVFEALPDARSQGLEGAMDSVFATGEPFYAHEQPVSLVRHGHAEVVYQNFVYQAYRDGSNNIAGILAISVNVTEQVLARKQMEHAYSQLRLARESAQLGTFDLDLETGRLEWDDRCCELFGVEPGTEVTYEQDFVHGLHEQDRERIVQAINAALAGHGDYDVEYRTVGRKDGTVRWVRAKGKVYFNEQGIASRFIGSVSDHTERKQDELKAQEEMERKARLAAIVDSSDDIIISKDLNGVIASWNPAAERSFGYKAAEAVGKHISLIIPQNRMDEERYILSQIRAGRKVDHFDTVRLGKDGRELQLSITVSPIINDEGKIIGASKIARDISMQLAVQAASKKYTRRLEALNKVANVVSENLDLNLSLQRLTDATTELTGARFGAFFYNKVDEDGKSYSLYTLSGASRADFERFGMPRNTPLFHPTFNGTGVVRVDDITKDPRYGKNPPHQGMPEGHLPVASYLAVPVISRSGNVIGGLFFGHPRPGLFSEEHESLVVSIAAQAAIGIDNSILYEKVLELNDKKDEFIGLASHELKTPLASINGYLQILKRTVQDTPSQNFLGKALQQVNKLTSLVNDLLDVSRIEAGKLKLSVAAFDLKPVIEETIELIRNTTDKYEIVFDTALDACTIEGDSRRIEQVVINLLSNAIKYSPGADRVEVLLREEGDRALVGIRDYGLGIEPAKARNIFSRFYRIDDATPNISGLGIGLYISHEIITRHKGDIWVDSEPGQGSTFWFSIPVKWAPVTSTVDMEDISA